MTALACFLFSAIGLVPALSAAEVPELRFVFIRNMAFSIIDGKTTLYTDSPYQSGYQGYMTYDFEAVPKAPGALCLVTHGHPDHFDATLFTRMDAGLIATSSVAAKVARVDVGCDLDHYKGDVGRTAPVSGRFDTGQRETWELLVAAYRAGLAVIRDGARRVDAFGAGLAEI
jgi:hypothetical protein